MSTCVFRYCTFISCIQNYKFGQNLWKTIQQ